MTVQELIEMLEEFKPDMQVRIAEQPNYPFEYSIEGLAQYDNGEGDCLYICEGGQLGYASKNIWDCIW